MQIINEKNNKYFIVLLTFTVIMAFLTVFGENGLVSLYRLSEKRDSIVSYNASLVKENQRLKEDIRRLKEDDSYIEKTARKELGMVGRKEIVFQFEK